MSDAVGGVPQGADASLKTSGFFSHPSIEIVVIKPFPHHLFTGHEVMIFAVDVGPKSVEQIAHSLFKRGVKPKWFHQRNIAEPTRSFK